MQCSAWSKDSDGGQIIGDRARLWQELLSLSLPADIALLDLNCQSIVVGFRLSSQYHGGTCFPQVKNLSYLHQSLILGMHQWVLDHLTPVFSYLRLFNHFLRTSGKVQTCWFVPGFEIHSLESSYFLFWCHWCLPRPLLHCLYQLMWYENQYFLQFCHRKVSQEVHRPAQCLLNSLQASISEMFSLSFWSFVTKMLAKIEV